MILGILASNCVHFSFLGNDYNTKEIKLIKSQGFQQVLKQMVKVQE